MAKSACELSVAMHVRLMFCSFQQASLGPYRFVLAVVVVLLGFVGFVCLSKMLVSSGECSYILGMF